MHMPAPGNILLLHPRQQLGLVDFGQVKHITLEERCVLQFLRLCIFLLFFGGGGAFGPFLLCSATPLPLGHQLTYFTCWFCGRLALARLILAVASKDKQRIVKCYTDMGTYDTAMDPHAYRPIWSITLPP